MKTLLLLASFIGYISCQPIDTAPELLKSRADDIDHEICIGQRDGWFINNPVTCRAFWVCIAEIGYGGECPPGYNFNERDQLCDLPEIYPCGTAESTTLPPSTGTGETDPTDSTPIPTTPPPDLTPFDCPPTGIHLFPKQGSCTQYHFCFGGNHTVRTCPTGLDFDSEQQSCNLPIHAQCNRNLCPVIDDITNVVTFPGTSRCEDFYICFNNTLLHMSCPNGTYWNQAIQDCDLPENSNCGVPTFPSIKCPTTEGLHIIPHPTDCKSYFICSNEIPFLRKCAPGLSFDKTLLECNFSGSVVC